MARTRIALSQATLLIRKIFLVGFLLHAFASQALSVSAITSDGTLGTKVTQGGTTYDITGGTRNGANLFHSLGLFSVGTGDTANFLNDTGLATTNVLGRVTGGQPSSIFGTIQTTNFGTAHLFLINPAGWVFGPTASLNVGGSFHVSTADYLKFADGAKFHADLVKQSVLTSAPVSAFGFLSQNPTGIMVFGSTLQTPAMESLTLTGGDVAITGGSLLAPSGDVSIVSVANQGEVSTAIPQSDVNILEPGGNVTLSGATIAVNGTRGGSVAIRGGRLDIEGSRIQAINFGGNEASAPGISLAVNGKSTITSSSLFTGTTGLGRGQDLLIEADNLTLVGGAEVGSVTFAGGKGGNVMVNAKDSIRISGIDGSRSAVFTDTQGSGGAGNIFVSSNKLTVEHGGEILANSSRDGDAGQTTIQVGSLVNQGGLISSRSLGTGPSGGITIQASDRISVGASDVINTPGFIASITDGRGGGDIAITTANLTLTDDAGVLARTNGQGDAGNVRVDVGRLTILGGASISSTSSAKGSAGTVTVNANDSVYIAGRDVANSPSGLFAITSGSGNAGRIELFTPSLDMHDGGISTTTGFGGGNAGDIVLNVAELKLLGGATIDSATFGPGSGGSVTVNATNSIQISGEPNAFGLPGGIATLTTGTGNGGRITISTPALTMDGPASIDASSGAFFTGSLITGRSGNIKIEGGKITLKNGAGISSDTFSKNNGGTIQISAQELTLSSGSHVLTQTHGDGRAGNIELQGSDIRLSDGAVISATSSGFGNAGDILIETREFRGTDSFVTTEALTADGGNIHLTVGKLVDLFNSKVTATVQGGEGSGGNITIDPTFVTLNHSQITANAFGGPGGNVKITADVFLASQDSSVTASSALSTPGTVDVRAAITNISGLLEPLPENIFQATSLLQQSCAARFSGGKLSSLVVSSRDGLPLEPGGFMPSLYRLPEHSNPSITQGSPGTEEASFTLASVKPKFFLNGPCVK